jgi:hypothetical protein
MAWRAKFRQAYGKHMGFRDMILKIIAFGLKMVGTENSGRYYITANTSDAASETLEGSKSWHPEPGKDEILF